MKAGIHFLRTMGTYRSSRYGPYRFEYISPHKGGRLFLRFLVLRVRTAPAAILLEIDFTLNKFLVLARPVVGAAALRTCEFYQLILRHVSFSYDLARLNISIALYIH